MIIFIVPKNSGLEPCRKLASELSGANSQILYVRGEDVGFFTEELAKQGKNVLGITGSDLFEEFKIKSKNTTLSIAEKIQWKDEGALFTKPVLCLLGPKNKSLKQMPKQLNICINKKYKNIAKDYLKKYQGIYEFNISYISGSTEETCVKQISDLIIDIVYTGKSIKEADLVVYDRILESDMVVLKADPGFTINELYQKICERINSDNKNSYTKKLAEDKALLIRKIIEESGELITAKDKPELIWESCDLLYFMLVLLAKNNISLEDMERENYRRDKETLLNYQKLDLRRVE